MQKNIGSTDKIIRLIIAIFAAILGYLINPWFYVLTVIALFTAFIGWCGLYQLLGINTCPIKSNDQIKNNEANK